MTSNQCKQAASILFAELIWTSESRTVPLSVLCIFCFLSLLAQQQNGSSPFQINWRKVGKAISHGHTCEGVSCLHELCNDLPGKTRPPSLLLIYSIASGVLLPDALALCMKLAHYPFHNSSHIKPDLVELLQTVNEIAKLQLWKVALDEILNGRAFGQVFFECLPKILDENVLATRPKEGMSKAKVNLVVLTPSLRMECP